MPTIVSKRWVGNVQIPTYRRKALRDNPGFMAMRRPPGEAEAVTEAWGRWIAGMGEWHLFGGLTYDQRRRRSDGRGGFIAPGADVARAHVYRWLRDAPLSIGRPIEAAVVALEYQRNGWPHFHPLLRVAGGLQGNEIAGLGGSWFERHGGNHLELPRSEEDVSAYAAKYLVKDLSRGDVILWRLKDRVTATRTA